MKWMLSLMLVTAALAGCIGGDDPESVERQSTLPDVLELPTYEGERLKMDVVVPVILIGFPEESEAKLAEILDKEVVDHGVGDFNQLLPPDPDEGLEGNMLLFGESWDLPMYPTARFDVRPVPASIEEEIGAKLDSWTVGEGNIKVLDANAFEAYLAEALPAAGFALDPNAPAMVLVHLGMYELGHHGFRYVFPHGHLQSVTSFGELHPMHIMVPSATRNFRASAPTAQLMQNVTGNEPNPYSDELEATGEDLREIEWLVREAVHYRFLHSAIYPMPLSDCHAMTLILAYRPTEVSDKIGLKSAEDLFHPDEIERAFENLTGHEVHLDAKVLMLPVDDPALDAFARGEFATLELMRFWLSANWENYWVEHEGCEPYVSFLIHGDVASTSTGIIGIGTYDQSKSYRISVSWVNEALRLAFDESSPLAPVSFFDDATGEYNWIDFLFTHEIGHTIGMHHPFHSGRKQGGTFSNQHFQDSWTSMSYSTDGRVIDFSAVDKATYQRNLAGYLFVAADHLGLADTEEWNTALEHTGMYHWGVATKTLQPLVMNAEGHEHERLPWLPGELVVMPSPSVGVHGFGPYE